jgi:hypothetical protein
LADGGQRQAASGLPGRNAEAGAKLKGVGGDKFGIQWSFEDVQVICQRASIPQKLDVPAFGFTQYDFAQAYVDEMANAGVTRIPSAL